MKKYILTGMLVAGAMALPTVMADTVDSDAATAGNFVKNSVITTKVKSKLAAKHMSTLTDVKVDTDAHGVVFLSGTAPTKDASDLAGMIAKDTDGVTSVHNKIVVSP